MRLKVSSKRVRVSLSILRMASSSVVSAAVTSANWRSRYSLRSLDSLSSSMAARFTWPSFSRSARAAFSDSSQAVTAASAARPGEDLGEIEARGGELLDECLRAARAIPAPPAAPVRSPARARIDARFGVQTFFIERAQGAVGLFERAPFGGELGFDRRGGARGNPRAAFELDDGLIAVGERGFELVAARLRLLPLIGHALETHAHRAFARAARLDADQQVAARELRSLRARTRRLHGLATLLALGFEAGAARIERVERHQAAIEFGAGARQRVLAQARLRA